MLPRLDSNKFPVVGNHLSLDFVNTEIVEDGVPKDLLTGPADLAAWALAVKLMERPLAEDLAANWQRASHAKEFKHVLQFRRELRALVAGLARGERVTPSALHAINAQLREASGYAEVLPAEEGFTKCLRLDIHTPGQLLAPVAEAAADLLCFGRLALVKKCENTECVLYFYDNTKNHSRRWCSMKGCGNRAKVAAFYQRQRQQMKR
ncbi:CGNR zinc finger domain-containing protein [Nitrospira sp. NS4]|uniref:CGNR zinc finger domain-containing protein n=1 Tax=Nitrospira sp. NS4 TaxID=3414498 RepID=UPI003C2E82A2